MKTALQTSITSTLTSDQNITQIIYFRARNLTCKNSPINVTQTSLLELVSTLTSDITLENIVKNSVMNDIMAKVSQTTEQVNKGIDLGLGLVLGLVALILAVFIIPKALKGGGGGGKDAAGNVQDALVSKDPRARAMAFIKKHKLSIAIVSVLLAIIIGIGIWLALIKAGIAPNVFMPDIAK
jgi:hypothetical protein